MATTSTPATTEPGYFCLSSLWFSAMTEEPLFRFFVVGLCYLLLRPALRRRPAEIGDDQEPEGLAGVLPPGRPLGRAGEAELEGERSRHGGRSS